MSSEERTHISKSALRVHTLTLYNGTENQHGIQQVQTAFNLDMIAEENSQRVELQSFSNIENTFDSGANVPNNNVELLINYKNMHPTNS